MKPKKKPTRALRRTNEETSFREVVALIEQAREHALRSVNTVLIELYWQVGEYISSRIETDGWGKGTVTALADYIRSKQLGVRGFSAPNLWRMRQFYATYHDEPKLSSLVRELTWTHNLLIQSACKRPEQREFYLRLAIRERWDTRELERQLKNALFERTVLSPPKLSAVLRELQPSAEAVFKDKYLLDFLDLPQGHSELDLQAALVANLRTFLLELGGDFTFVGERFRVQVGGRDFELDLLFFHRGLNCLVAIELKIDEFQPEYLGKLEFYLEALDRDVRKPHEQPSIGALLCATKNNEVVEYALARSVSPALIAEYQTQLPDKKLLERKLHEFYQLAMPPPDRQRQKSKPTRSVVKPAAGRFNGSNSIVGRFRETAVDERQTSDSEGDRTMDTDYRNIPAVGQFDRMSCWAAALSWWLKAVGGGRPPLSQSQIIQDFDYLCDDDGSLSPKNFKHVVCKDARFRISMNYFTVSKYAYTGLPIGDSPVIIVYKYPAVGGTHMNVVFDKRRDGPAGQSGGITVNCMEPFHPLDAKDGRRTGTFVRRSTSHFLGSQEIGLAWATPSNSEGA